MMGSLLSDAPSKSMQWNDASSGFLAGWVDHHTPNTTPISRRPQSSNKLQKALAALVTAIGTQTAALF